MKKLTAGFTLIELIIVVAIVGVLASLAAPSFSTMIKNNRLASNINDLTSDLALARSESNKRGRRVTVCPSTNGTSCSGASAWATGRLVFVDLDADGTVDSGDEILRVSSALGGNNTMVYTGPAPGNTSYSFIQYRPKGITNTVGTFKLCDDRTGAFGRTIEVTTTGRASLTSTGVTCP